MGSGLSASDEGHPRLRRGRAARIVPSAGGRAADSRHPGVQPLPRRPAIPGWLMGSASSRGDLARLGGHPRVVRSPELVITPPDVPMRDDRSHAAGRLLARDDHDAKTCLIAQRPLLAPAADFERPPIESDIDLSSRSPGAMDFRGITSDAWRARSGRRSPSTSRGTPDSRRPEDCPGNRARAARPGRGRSATASVRSPPMS